MHSTPAMNSMKLLKVVLAVVVVALLAAEVLIPSTSALYAVVWPVMKILIPAAVVAGLGVLALELRRAFSHQEEREAEQHIEIKHPMKHV